MGWGMDGSMTGCMPTYMGIDVKQVSGSRHVVSYMPLIEAPQQSGHDQEQHSECEAAYKDEGKRVSCD